VLFYHIPWAIHTKGPRTTTLTTILASTVISGCTNIPQDNVIPLQEIGIVSYVPQPNSVEGVTFPDDLDTLPFVARFERPYFGRNLDACAYITRDGLPTFAEKRITIPFIHVPVKTKEENEYFLQQYFANFDSIANAFGAQLLHDDVMADTFESNPRVQQYTFGEYGKEAYTMAQLIERSLSTSYDPDKVTLFDRFMYYDQRLNDRGFFMLDGKTNTGNNVVIFVRYPEVVTDICRRRYQYAK